MLAKQFGTEIVSADSRQFYREMNIGTAKPKPDELDQVPHHMINSLSIHDSYSAGQFETDALESILKIFSVSDHAILCGGSGLYVDLVCRGADEMPARNEKLRLELNDIFNREGIHSIQKRLKELDPEYYLSADLNNPHRLIRAIEVCITTGKKYSDLRTSKVNKRPFNIIKIGLEEEREIVYRMIDERVDRMMNENLLDEAKSLYRFRDLNALQTVGYSELFDFLDGKLTLDEAVNLIRQHTRNYAKRQWTWFRKDKEIAWFRPKDYKEIISYITSRTN